MRSPQSAAQFYGESAKVARCLAERHDTGDLIGGPGSNDPKFANLADALKNGDKTCLRGTGGAVPMLVSGALAARQIDAMDVTWEDRAKSVDMDKAELFYMPKKGASASLDSVGRCVAVFSPGLAHTALQTEPGTSAETAAFGKLYQATPECGLKAVPTKIAMPFQRVAIANGLYHWLEMRK